MLYEKHVDASYIAKLIKNFILVYHWKKNNFIPYYIHALT